MASVGRLAEECHLAPVSCCLIHVGTRGEGRGTRGGLNAGARRGHLTAKRRRPSHPPPPITPLLPLGVCNATSCFPIVCEHDLAVGLWGGEGGKGIAAHVA